MKTKKIPYIPGDGIGPEIMNAARQVVDTAIATAYNGEVYVDWIKAKAGEPAFQETGDYLPDATMALIKAHKIAIKGPLTTPVGGGYRSLNVALRQALDLYVCQRPVKWFHGLPSPHRTPDGIDVVIFRENIEDLYAGIEYQTGTPKHLRFMQAFQAMKDDFKHIPSPAECGIGIKPISKSNSQRLVRAAIQWAIDNNRRRLTLVHKGNIMKYTEGAFMQWGYEEALQFSAQVYTHKTYQKTAIEQGQVKADEEKAQAMLDDKLWMDDVIADVAFEQLITKPQQFDVIATTNLNGDYLSDAAAALAGGVGISPGANINPTNGTALFEANHGSAQQIAGRNMANPSSLILSAAMMLTTIGWKEAADIIRNALTTTIKNKQVTFDLAAQIPDANRLGTKEFTAQIIAYIKMEEK